MIKLTTIFILFLSVTAAGQRSVADLKPAHATALETYLSANKTLTFRQEHNLEDEYLVEVHKWFGNKFKPNYAVADFNRDKIMDFAVLLYRDGESVEGGGSEEPHKTDHPLRLVVFNGQNKGFRVAYTTDLMGPHAAFIHFDKSLYYGVFESDADSFILAPAGKGYIMEFEKPRKIK